VSDIHTDLWDAHVDSDAPLTLWVASDGGVYRSDGALNVPFPGTPPYVHQNQGLHTHHAHTLTVASGSRVGRARLAYSTADNDAWVFSSSSSWQTPNVFGDANWTDGDAANGAAAILSRNKEVPWLTGFGHNLPNGSPWRQFVINTDQSFESGPFRYILQFIQTLNGESPIFPHLDAVLMQRRPLAQPDPKGELVLVRNRQFALNPEFTMANLNNWSVELNNLPPGTRGFWVAGGHAHPSYYLYADDSGTLKLFKRTGTLPPPNQTSWQPLNVSGLLDGAFHGPAYVNPYDPSRLLVLTDTGTKMSSDGGFSFQDAPVINSLITGSGRFPLTGSFAGGNNAHVVIGGKTSLATLVDVAFSREHPEEMLIASPFTGVFYSSGDGHWRDLSAYLPQPRTPVSAVGMDCEAAYVAMEGRSVVRIRGYRDAPLAGYFLPVAAPTVGSRLATLLVSPEQPVAAAAVQLEITTPAGAVVFTGNLRTDARGALLLPNIADGTYVAHLHSTATATVAPAETSFAFKPKIRPPRLPQVSAKPGT
jgi:hypothetical protein